MPAVRVAECQTAADVWKAARDSEARRKAWNAPRPKPEPEPPKEPERAVIHTEFTLVRWMGRPAVEIWREMLAGRRRVRIDEQSLDDAFPRPLVEDVIRAVARAYGFRSTDLKAARRDGRVIRARHVAMLLCKLLTLRSFPKIARCFGNRDHTTALHACRKLAWLAPQLEALHTLGDPASAWAATAARLYPLPAGKTEEVAE